MADLKATPRNALLGLLADAAQGTSNFVSQPFGYANPPGEMLMQALGVPALAKTLDTASYGGGLTRGTGYARQMLPDTAEALLSVLPGGVGAKSAAPVAKQAAKVAAKELSPQAEKLLMDFMVKQGGIKPIKPWHGSPHFFDKFSLDKIGTGEGAQAYGHGLYFADNKNIGQSYADVLASPKNNLLFEKNKAITIEKSPFDDGLTIGVGRDGDRALGQTGVNVFYPYDETFTNPKDALDFAISKGLLSNVDVNRLKTYSVRPDDKKVFESDLSKITPNSENQFIVTEPGNLYQVEIPDEAVANMLQWDNPVPDNIINKIRQPIIDRFESGPTNTSGEKLYKELVFNFRMSGSKNPQADASAYLNQLGIPGIRYLDAGSRSAGEGSMNTVLFDDSLVKILERNGVPMQGLLNDVPKPTKEVNGYTFYDQADPATFDYFKSQLPANATDQQVRLAIGQKNAEIMGLPAGNTPMDRAKALGFGDGWMHGTNKDFPEFKSGDTYMITDPSEASRYAEIASRTSGGANVIPLMTRGQTVGPKEYDSAYEALSKERGASYIPSKEVHTSLSKSGVAGYKEGDTQIIFNPANIRSRFAAFDPARINENNLLASRLLPFALPGLLGYGMRDKTTD